MVRPSGAFRKAEPVASKLTIVTAPNVARNLPSSSISAGAQAMRVPASGPLASVSHRTILAHGMPAQEIIRVAQEQQADLIVISTHGRTGLKHLFMGSTAERVIRHAHCPVLVVR